MDPEKREIQSLRTAIADFLRQKYGSCSETDVTPMHPTIDDRNTGINMSRIKGFRVYTAHGESLGVAKCINDQFRHHEALERLRIQLHFVETDSISWVGKNAIAP